MISCNIGDGQNRLATSERARRNCAPQAVIVGHASSCAGYR